ncbi:Histone-lysine N-methyltransferase SETMAR [Eumeta japonica]|uniref:Histone-lysine N-methyltransferase SETMAR n=1 Tax=Eumeta variegata TaxID=151549 RepID=A0A4C1Y7A0_EUMVA|nr:Histone-lysine N-methyltransferase SETMAR [Eumeta japonica]
MFYSTLWSERRVRVKPDPVLNVLNLPRLNKLVDLPKTGVRRSVNSQNTTIYGSREHHSVNHDPDLALTFDSILGFVLDLYFRLDLDSGSVFDTLTYKVNAILEKLKQDWHIRSYDITEELKINHKTVSTHMTNDGDTKKLDTWVPHELYERNLMNRELICDCLLKRNETETFLKRLITGDEKWIANDKNVRKRSWSKGKQAPQIIAKPVLTRNKLMLRVCRPVAHLAEVQKWTREIPHSYRLQTWRSSFCYFLSSSACEFRWPILPLPLYHPNPLIYYTLCSFPRGQQRTANSFEISLYIYDARLTFNTAKRVRVQWRNKKNIYPPEVIAFPKVTHRMKIVDYIVGTLGHCLRFSIKSLEIRFCVCPTLVAIRRSGQKKKCICYKTALPRRCGPNALKEKKNTLKVMRFQGFPFFVANSYLPLCRGRCTKADLNELTQTSEIYDSAADRKTLADISDLVPSCGNKRRLTRLTPRNLWPPTTPPLHLTAHGKRIPRTGVSTVSVSWICA